MLKVANLVKAFPGEDGPVTVIDGISFCRSRGPVPSAAGPKRTHSSPR
jgi:hypothetical protein